MAVPQRTAAVIAFLAVIVLAGVFWFFPTRHPAGKDSATDDGTTAPEHDWSIFSEVRTDTADTSTWKVYEDRRLGFRTKIPEDWEVRPIPFPYEGSDDFVMFMRSDDPGETIVVEMGFSYYWNTSYESAARFMGIPSSAIQKLVEDSQLRALVGIAERGYGPSDYSSDIYTFEGYRVVKHMLPVTEDPEGRWEGDKKSSYDVYVENSTGGINSFAFDLFSPQIPEDETDAIAHGILHHLVRL